MMEARRLKKAVIIGCALVATGLAAQNAQADDTYWILPPPAVDDWFEATNWTLGVPNSSDYAYITNGGEAWIAAHDAEAYYLYLGYDTGESGALTQTGGTNTLGWALHLGSYSGAEGTYELSGTGSLSANYEYIGYSGTGTFTQTGGANTLGGTLFLGHYGTGTFTQTGGTNTVGLELFLGSYSGGQGTYELSGTASLSADSEYIGLYGTGTFTQTGGTNTICYDLHLGLNSGAEGTYELSGDGSLSADDEYIGYEGTGTFTQAAGTNIIHYGLHLGCSSSGSQGTYELSGTGSLSADREDIGRYGTGTFTQTGGTNTVTATLYLGRYSGSSGTYTMSAGNLSTADFIVGSDGSGILNITDSAANITVSNLLRLGDDSTLTAAPGATIHMTGSAFENESTDPDALAGLANLELIFEGGTGDTDPFEIAGEDRGAVWDGFVGNFTLGGLTLGGADVGLVQLGDTFDNGNRGGPAGAAEALYLHDLIIGPRSILDMNGLHVYYDGRFISAGTIQNGQPIYVPEPATLALLAVGGVVMLFRKRKQSAT
jgi:hypothetical protein